MIYLNVPYEQKDEVKSLGARWDVAMRKWHVPPCALLTPFERWLPARGVVSAMLARDALAAPVVKSRKPKTKRVLSMSDAAIRARENKAAAKASRRAARRVDATGSKIIIGAGYAPVEGATGLPWA